MEPKQQLWSPPELDSVAAFNFPSEFPYEFEPSSPAVESSTDSTESSDEEENFFASLTQRLSLSTLHETRTQLTTSLTKTRDVAGSPQSTLSGIGSWSCKSNGSGNGSPNGNSRVPSPLTAPLTDPWDVIYAAANQVARLNVNHSVGPTNVHIFSNQNLNHVRQEAKPNQECGSGWKTETDPNWLIQQKQLLIQNRCNVPLYFPPQQNQQRVQQYSGSGFRVPVHGGSTVKKSSGGTGVFLPRHYDSLTSTTPSDSRKKTGCGSVMLPAKVNVVNSNIDDRNVTTQQRFSNVFPNDYYDLLLARRNALLQQQRLLVARREEAASCEIRLPHEWTY